MSSPGRAGAGMPPGRVAALADAIRTVAPLDAPAADGPTARTNAAATAKATRMLTVT